MRAEEVTNTSYSMAEGTYCLHDLKLQNPWQPGENKQNENSQQFGNNPFMSQAFSI